MEQENAETIAVYAPRMHGALIPGETPDAVLRFDPGIPAAPQGPAARVAQDAADAPRKCWQPRELPLDPKQARAWVREMLAWGMQFDSPGQIASLAAAESLHKQRDIGGMPPHEMDDLRRFTASIGSPESREPADVQAAARLQAQLHLLLAWNLEERSLELSTLGSGIADQYERFGKALGLEEDEEAAQAGLTKPLLPEEGATLLPRLEVVAAMLAFLPAGSWLYSDDQELRAVWQEQGLVFAPVAEQGLQPPQGLDDVEAAEAPGWRFAGLQRPDANRPWLDATFVAAFPAA